MRLLICPSHGNHKITSSSHTGGTETERAKLNIAWGDESIRAYAPQPTYLLGAVVPPQDCNLSSLQAVKPKGAAKLHWREMTDDLKAESLQAIRAISPHVFVVKASPIPHKRPERARRKCLEALLPTLERNGVKSLVLESRTLQLDKKDREMLLAMRRSGLVSSLDIEHLYGANEPHLWMPDQILGAYGDALCASPGCEKWMDAWREIQELVAETIIPL